MPANRLLVPGCRLRLADATTALYAGICTEPSGALYALLLLDAKPTQDLTWQQATAWAQAQGGELPNRPEGAQLFAVLKSQFDTRWHWTREPHGSSYAWVQNFDYGSQGYYHQSNEFWARAVRRLPLQSFDALAALAASVEASA